MTFTLYGARATLCSAPWPSPRQWPRDVFFGVHGMFFSELAVELVLRETGVLARDMQVPSTRIARALRQATLAFRDALVECAPPCSGATP